MPNDLEFQNLSTVNNQLQPKPRTITAAATIAPTTFLTFLTGATAVATITPPVTGAHMLCVVATLTTSTTVTTGNIAAAVALGQNIATMLVYDPLTAKYYPGAIS